MKTISNRLTPFTLCCALAFASMSLPLQAQKGKPGGGGSTPAEYTVIQLSAPAGFDRPSLSDLDNLGRVVGSANVAGGSDWVGVLWDANGTAHLLPPLPDHSRSHADSVCDTGLIAGHSIVPGSGGPVYENIRAVWWEPTSNGFLAHDWNDLLPADLAASHHLGMRSYLSPDGRFVALTGRDRNTGLMATVIAEILYDWNDRVAGLAVIDFLPGTRPWRISNDGETVRVVGSEVGENGALLGGLYWLRAAGQEPEFLISLDPLVEGRGVNRWGQVVGWVRVDLSPHQALIWEEAALWDPAAATDLRAQGGIAAMGNNDLGLVVGRATTGGRKPEDRAFLYRNGVVQDLNTLTSTKLALITAYRINNGGHILSGAKVNGSTYTAVLLVPTAGQ